MSLPNEKITKAQSGFINWNYIGIISGTLAIIVAIYNIQRYYKQIKKNNQE